MRWSIVSGIAFALMAAAFAQPPVGTLRGVLAPRPAADFTAVDQSGKQLHLSAYKGKVVLVQFLYTTCSHCQAAARMYSKLQNEMGAKGFQVLGVAFNPEAQGNPAVLRKFIEDNGVGFPVGVASVDTVLSYLGISQVMRFMVPQILIVDRKGRIRAQSAATGSPELQDENYLRGFIGGLLKEGSRAK